MTVAVWWWFLDPLHGAGYQLWSGIGIVPLAWLLTAVTFYRRHNCHVRWCPRIQWHEVELDDGRVFNVCKRHHPDGEIGCPDPRGTAPKADA